MFLFAYRDGFSTRIGRVKQSEGEVYPIVRIAVPDGYRAGMYYDDIAVLTLEREVNFPNFNPICLPDDRILSRNLTGRGTTVAGWGATKSSKNHDSTTTATATNDQHILYPVSVTVTEAFTVKEMRECGSIFAHAQNIFNHKAQTLSLLILQDGQQIAPILIKSSLNAFVLLNLLNLKFAGIFK